MASNRSRFEQLLDKYEPLLKAAFLDAIADIKSRVTLKLLVEALERGDIFGAIDLLGIEREAFGPLELVFAEAYNAGGMDMADSLKLRDPNGNRVLFRFGVRNPEAEAWLKDHSATMVTRIVEDQKASIQQALTQGLVQGQNPGQTALDVVGRISRVTGKREGGVIGLTAPQEQFVAAARQELLSGEPDRLKHYLTRERRDKRFDAAVMKAIKAGRALDRATVDKIAGRYADRLLALRGEMLSRTETMMALGKSRDDAMNQAIMSGKVDVQDVTGTWRSAGDNRVRHTHRALNGQTIPFGGSFQSPSGAALRHPGDPSAPISETSGCRCWMEYKVDYFAKIVRQQRAA